MFLNLLVKSCKLTEQARNYPGIMTSFVGLTEDANRLGLTAADIYA
jgi:hypothetical protein